PDGRLRPLPDQAVLQGQPARDRRRVRATARDGLSRRGTGSMAAREVRIVDDSATERHFMSELFGKQGYVVITAENGEEAVAKARSERPSVVVMDVVMPGQSGFQITRALSRDPDRSEEHTSELQSRENLVCRLLLEKKNEQDKDLTRDLDDTA